jgi:hypothetical protein
MNSFNLIETFPLWASYLVIILITLGSAWCGITFSKWRKKRICPEEDAPINTIVGATLALLAFILAFAFGMTSTRYEARKQFLLEEVNSIETAWLRAGLIAEPQQSKVKGLLEEYVQLRIEFSQYPEKVNELIHRSEETQKEIWGTVTTLVEAGPRNDEVNALFIESINQVFDNHTKRVVTGLIDHIPGLFWMALFILVILAMFEVGYLIGKMDTPNWYMIIALTLAFSAIILLIIDLDSVSGTIHINHQPMFDLHQRLITK